VQSVVGRGVGGGSSRKRLVVGRKSRVCMVRRCGGSLVVGWIGFGM